MVHKTKTNQPKQDESKEYAAEMKSHMENFAALSVGGDKAKELVAEFYALAEKYSWPMDGDAEIKSFIPDLAVEELGLDREQAKKFTEVFQIKLVRDYNWGVDDACSIVSHKEYNEMSDLYKTSFGYVSWAKGLFSSSPTADQEDDFENSHRSDNDISTKVECVGDYCATTEEA